MDRKSTEAALGRFRELGHQTKNPMYMWMAILCSGWLRQAEADYKPTEAPFILPGWCAEYLTNVAWDFSCLSSGMDIGREGEAGKDYPALSSADAMDMVTQALGFTRRGYSAFDQMRSTLDLMGLFHRYEEIRSGGRSSTTAIEELMVELGMDEERSVRRRISSGRRLVKGERPEEEGGEDKT